MEDFSVCERALCDSFVKAAEIYSLRLFKSNLETFKNDMKSNKNASKITRELNKLSKCLIGKKEVEREVVIRNDDADTINGYGGEVCIYDQDDLVESFIQRHPKTHGKHIIRAFLLCLFLEAMGYTGRRFYELTLALDYIWEQYSSRYLEVI